MDKARDTILGRTVALKTMVHSFGAAAEQKQFLREAQIVSQLSHPAIINLYDVGIEEENVAYLVMEFVAGKTLQQAISESPIPVPRACAWGADLASALGRAHQAGIIHGDVKPANILVTETGNVKLGDFGIARFATQVSGSGRLLGTPAYLSPEQIMGQPQNMRSDLFSLGIVLYQMVTGVRPFDGTSVGAVCAQILSAEPQLPSKRNPAITQELDRIIMRCLAKNPAERYPSGDALAASLYPFARHPGIPEEEEEQQSWFVRPIQSREAWAFGAALFAAACLIPVSRTVAAHFQAPSPILFTAAAPRPPEDLAGSGSYAEAALITVAPDPPDMNAPPNYAGMPAEIPHKRVPSRARGAHAIVPARRTSVDAPTAPALPAAIPEPAPAPLRRAALDIEIDSSVGDGTLAVFDDHDLVVTTELHAASGDDPIRLERELPVGPHELRVALYRADKSLQTEREGLAEIRVETVNSLKIRVTRRSKLLLKHETFLDVTWPTAITPQTSAAKPAVAGLFSTFQK